MEKQKAKLERSVLNSQTWRFSQFDEKGIQITGVDMGPQLEEVYRNGNYAIWRRAGYTEGAGTDWATYYSPTLFIVKIEMDSEIYETPATHEVSYKLGKMSVRYGQVEFLFDVESTKHTWRDAKKLVEAKVDELANA